MLQRTKIFGRVHPDTIAFDDSQILGNSTKETSIAQYSTLKQIKISKMKIWSGNNVNGIQVCYKMNSGEERWADEHLGTHGNFEPHLIEFHDDEYLIGIAGKCGSYMDNLTVKTNKNKYSFGTSQSGLPYTIELPFNCVPIAFVGGIGGHLHNIGLVYFSFQEWDPELHMRFPEQFKTKVKTLLLASLRNCDGKPRHPESLLYELPKDLIFQILKLASEEFLKDQLIHYEPTNHMRCSEVRVLPS